MRSVVILPTYNESGNLRPVTEQILRVSPESDVLVVDDASPDGTGRIADELAKETGRVFVIHRTEPRGRGAAGLDGFRWALERNYEAVVEMDADLSHSPRYIPQLIGGLRDADVVIGSRCVPGAETARKNVFRNALSAAAHTMIRALLRTKVRDCTSGFRAFRRGALASLPLERMVSVGPSVVEEILYACEKKQLRIREIPIRFEERRSGRSKLGVSRLLETLFTLVRVRFRRAD